MSPVAEYYIKLVYTTRVHIYAIPLNWTLDRFFEYVKSTAQCHFGISDASRNDIEFVLCGNYTRNQRPEDAPAICLTASNQDKLVTDLFGHRNSFYIRTITPLPLSFHHNYSDTCFICLEQTMIRPRYRCRHAICMLCYMGCIDNGITRCGLCRSE